MILILKYDAFLNKNISKIEIHLNFNRFPKKLEKFRFLNITSY